MLIDLKELEQTSGALVSVFGHPSVPLEQSRWAALAGCILSALIAIAERLEAPPGCTPCECGDIPCRPEITD